MASKTFIVSGVLFLISSCSSQHLGIPATSHPAGICTGVYSNSVQTLQKLKGCVTVVGNIQILLMEKTNSSAFQGVSFPELREVTGYLMMYRVMGLESMGQLFPSLTRIRGLQLFKNYALVVHDMPGLRDVGFFSLLKIDRGGVIIWGGPHTCYVETVNWTAIAPRARHMLTYPEMTAHCNIIKPCKCKKQHNFCWNNKNCQRFDVQGACHPECLGCVPEKPKECSVCRHFTYEGRCISQCPHDTILLQDNQYCITVEECKALNGWVWRNNCIFECPADYMKIENKGEINCVPCSNCKTVCPSMKIDTLSSIQEAEKCVYIHGSLVIHVRSVPGSDEELRKYLKRIEVVTDFIHIYGSLNMSNLYFLSSLRQIGGKTLDKDTYSLIINDMKNLEEIFSPEVMEQLQIDRGKLKVFNNPMLCMDKIDQLKAKFTESSSYIDIPPGLNGFGGDCEKDLNFSVQTLNQSAVEITFTPRQNVSLQYTVLYAKVSPEKHKLYTPDTCSKAEWYALHADSSKGRATLTSLTPAATYVICVETCAFSVDNSLTYLSRTKTIKIEMPFNKPKPPFIKELVATSPYAVGLQWIDHRDYRSHITSYLLDVRMIDIHSKDVGLRDHCNVDYLYSYFPNEDFSRHIRLLKPPIEYDICESSCLTLAPGVKDMIEDDFDICNSMESICDQYEEISVKNTTFNGFVKTLSLVIGKPKSIFYVQGLAPFRDYKFILRSCAKNKCSRSTRGVIRTLPSRDADIPSLTNLNMNETHLTVKWKPPDQTNGPLFAYFVQVLPGDAVNGSLPDIWCLYPNKQSLVVRSQVHKEFRVRVCASSLGSYNTCTEWMSISTPSRDYSILIGSIVFSIILMFISIVTGFLYNRRKKHSDDVPLVDLTSMYRNESEPPAVMLTDIMPLYTVPWNEAL